MAKFMKKAQGGKNVPKGMVESEMFPGKMIPKSKSNYENSNYDKMLGGKSSAPKPKGLNFDKKSFDKLPTLKSKVIKKPKAQGGLLLKAVGRSLEKTVAKRAIQTAEKKVAQDAEKEGWKQMRKLQRFEEGRIKSPLSKKDKETGTNYRNSPAGIKYNDDTKKFWDGYNKSMRKHGATVIDKPKMKSGGMLKRADGKIIKKAQSGLRENLFKRGREAVATPSKQINKYATDERDKKWEREWEEDKWWLEDPKKSLLPGLVQEMKDYKSAHEDFAPPGEYYDNATNSYKKYPKKPEISYVKMLKDTGGYQRSGGKTSKTKMTKPKMKSGGKVMLKRKDGSTSQRGLWDNIRAAKGSGKKPTSAMLKQEKKIKAKTKK